MVPATLEAQVSMYGPCYPRGTQSKADPSGYNEKIKGCYRITKTIIYTEYTIDILCHKEAR
jgi:hypothetical protein